MAFARLTVSGLAVDHAPGPGVRVLFVHGASAGAWTWDNFMRQFSAAGYDCYAMNLRGHPPSPPVAALGQVSMRDYADDVRSVLRELGGDVVLCGHSMGGALAQMVGEQALLRAVVMAAPAPVAGVAFEQPPVSLAYLLYGLKMVPAILRKKPLHPAWKVVQRTVLNKVPPERQRALYDRMVPESSVAGIEVVKGEISGDLRAVSYPKLVIAGTDDLTARIGMQREIAAQQQADLIELPGHGHMFMLEPGWERCGEQILQWLQANEIV